MAALAAFAAVALAGDAPTIWRWVGAPRVVVLGDIHGNADNFDRLLKASGLLKDGHWSGGQDHLVVLGDMVDRGPNDRLVLDRVRALEREASTSGGFVHPLLGNHEVMNLVRDLRYVSEEGYRGFVDLELPADRARARAAFLAANEATEATRDGYEQAFDRDHPPGYFGRLRAFGPGGDIAEWLLSHPALIVVDGTAFVHGGLNAQNAAPGGAEVNRQIAQNVRDFWRIRAVFEARPGAPPFMTFDDVRRAARAVEKAGDAPAAVVTAARELKTVLAGPAFAADGPLWYRGLSVETERAEADSLSAALDALDAHAVVVGHTPTQQGVVTSRFHGRVVRADVGLYSSGHPAGVILRNGTIKTFDAGQVAPAQPEPPNAEPSRAEPPRAEPPWGETRTASPVEERPDAELEKLLVGADIVAARPLGGTHASRPRLLDLAEGSVKLRGLLKIVDQPGDTWKNEVAAYRLDRALGLRMVPVTVERKVGDVDGSVQAWIDTAVDQTAVAAYGLAVKDPAAIAGQLRRARIFDALIGNTARTPKDVLLLLPNSRVLLVDHTGAFPRTTDVPGLLGPEPCRFDPALRDALSALKPDAVKAATEGLLDKEQVTALFARRDRILALCR